MSKTNAALDQVNALVKKAGGKGKGKKGRKIGRYSKSPSCARYRSERRWEKNKLMKLRRHLKALPADSQARSALSRLGSKDDLAFLASLPKVEA